MALNLYSAATTDSLLATKLSDAPSDGNLYGRKDGTWTTVTGTGSINTDIANAIAANIAFVTASSNYGRWVGN